MSNKKHNTTTISGSSTVKRDTVGSTTYSGSNTKVFNHMNSDDTLEDSVVSDILKSAEELSYKEEFSLQNDGDTAEKENYTFINENFPRYEIWWQKNVVPLTNRPNNIHFKNESELSEIGKGYSDIMLAQMSYTVLIHLISLNRLIGDKKMGYKDAFYEFFSRASALIDVTCDFCVIRKTQELKDGLNSDPNLNKMSKYLKESDSIKKYGHLVIDFSLVKPIRTYRNSLLHGVMPPSLNGMYPILDKISAYEDWRTVTNVKLKTPNILDEFDDPQSIAEDTFNIIVNFLNTNW